MLSLAYLTACASPQTTTNDTADGIETKEININRSYTELNISTAIDVEYSNTASQLILTGSTKYIPYVKVTEQNRKLRIYLELPNDMQQHINAGNIQVVLPTSKALQTIQLSGACRLTGNEIKAEKLYLTASGACSVEMDFDIAHSLQANTSGTSSLNGQNLKADNLDLSASGASKVNTDFQITSRMSANVSGASNFNGAVKAESILMQVSGASHSNSTLSANSIHLNVSGASNDNSTISAPTVNFKLSGNSASTTSITAEQANLNLSGASDIQGSVKVQELQLQATSNSFANLKGKADHCNAMLSGAAQLSSRSAMLETQTFHCEASGNSKAYIRCNSKVTGTANGASTLYFYGNATNQIVTKSAGKVIHK
ncbi:lipoprotein [gut metagenome]|uniref:Lipoprotein n=1 Tax=gut metagenome TaxID=749906 RepID=J9CVD6_9ZZZZ